MKNVHALQYIPANATTFGSVISTDHPFVKEVDSMRNHMQVTNTEEYMKKVISVTFYLLYNFLFN
jgi:hypothetical protein